MGRAALIAGSILLLAPSFFAQAQDDTGPVELLSFTFTSMVLADTGLTYEALRFHNCYEANPFWAPIMKYPPLVLTLDLAICVGVTYAAKWLYRRNKMLGVMAIILVNVMEGYYILYQVSLRQDRRWR